LEAITAAVSSEQQRGVLGFKKGQADAKSLIAVGFVMGAAA